MPEPESPFRIAMLAPSPDVHGPVGKHTGHLIAALEAAGCSVTRMTWGRTSDAQGAGVRMLSRMRDVLTIRRALHRGTYNVLIVKTAHDWATLSRDLALLGVRRSRPVTILQFHGSAPDRLGSPQNRAFTFASRLLVSLSDGIMVLSSDEQRAWGRVAGGKPIRLVCNPYERRPDAGESIAEPSTGKTLLFAGRLIEQKGAGDVLAAAARLGDPEIEVSIAGEGPDRARLELLAKELAVSAQFLGHLDAHGMAKAYRSADIFVLPTRWDEGFPTVISEAMDFGLPIVTTRSRGMADHLVDGVNAMLIEPGNTEQLVKALGELLSDDALRASMGAANREAVAQFEPPVVAAGYLQVIQEIVAQSDPHGRRR